jgi:hypothetical protein
MCGHCFRIKGFRVFTDSYRRPIDRIVHLTFGPHSVRRSTCPFVKLASATVVQGWRPKFDMHVRQPGEHYSCARLASFDVAQRAWTCAFVKPWSRPQTKFDNSKFAVSLQTGHFSKSNESANLAPIHGANAKSRRQPLTIPSSLPRIM